MDDIRREASKIRLKYFLARQTERQRSGKQAKQQHVEDKLYSCITASAILAALAWIEHHPTRDLNQTGLAAIKHEHRKY